MLHYILHLAIPSFSQEDGFTEVTHGRKKRKASNSPTLPSQPKSGFSEPPLGTTSMPQTKPKKQNSSDTQWCRRKIKKLKIHNRRIEAVPPWPQSFSDQGITKR